MNANDSFTHCTSTDSYHSYMCGMKLTDGVVMLAEKFQCFWFLDVISSYQHELKGEGFQVWKLTKHLDGSCTVVCEDGNKRELKRQVIPFTDFIPTTATIWAVDSIILLPSEY